MSRAILVAFLVLFPFSAWISADDERALKPLSLGDSDADLVFTPIAPCRLFDTRRTGSPIAGGSSRSFIVVGSTGFDTQGGTAGGCGVPPTATSVLINFVAVAPQGTGNLRGSAYGQPMPATGSIINYQALTPPLNIANGLATPICDHTAPAASCTFDLTLFANGAGADVVGDVFGYYKRFPREETITSILAGDGLSGGGTAGAVTMEIATEGVGTTQLANESVTPDKINTDGSTGGQVLMSTGESVSWQTPPQGDITEVMAGPGISGGGTSGSVALSADFAASGALGGNATRVARADHRHYTRTVIVNAVGTDTENGAELINKLDSITDSSETNRYLLKIEPGIFDIGIGVIVSKAGMNLEGSGINATKIRGHNLWTFDLSHPISVRQLTIETIISGFAGYGILASTEGRVDVEDVRVLVTGGEPARGFFGNTTGTFHLRNVEFDVTAGPFAEATGLHLNTGTAILESCTISAAGNDAIGIHNNGQLVVRNTEITAKSSRVVIGLRNRSAASLRGTVIRISDGTLTRRGVENENDLTLDNVDITAPAGTGAAALANTGTRSSSVDIQNSRLSSPANPIATVASFTTRVSFSRLEGGPVSGPVTCAWVVDESLTTFQNICP